MTDKQYVNRAAAMRKLEVVGPSKADRTILVFDWSSGFGKVVVEASTWATTRTALNAYLAGTA